MGRSRPDLVRRMEAVLRKTRSVEVVERLTGRRRPTVDRDVPPHRPGVPRAPTPSSRRPTCASLGREPAASRSCRSPPETAPRGTGPGSTGRFRLRRERIVRSGLLSERTFSYPPGRPGWSAPGRSGRATIPVGPFVLAREDDDLAVGFAARPAAGGRLAVTTTVIGPDGQGATRPRARGTAPLAGGLRARAAACGAGCYAASVPSPAGPGLRGRDDPQSRPGAVDDPIPVPLALAAALTRRGSPPRRRGCSPPCGR